MPFLFRLLAARWINNRMLGGRGRRAGSGYGRGGYGRGYGRSGYGGGYGFGGGRQMARRGYGRSSRRGRAGFWGPFPYYSTRTRGGSRVTVGGCCLPLALGMLATPLMALRLLVKRGR